MRRATVVTVLQCDDEIKKYNKLIAEEEHKIKLATQNKDYYTRIIGRLEKKKKNIGKKHLAKKPV